MKLERRWALLLAAAGLFLVGLAGAALVVLDRYDVPTRLKARLAERFRDPPAEVKKPPLPPIDRKYQIERFIYDGGLKEGWEDYGWATREVQGPGPAKLRFSNYAGWIINHPAEYGDFGALVLKMKAPAEHGDFLEVSLESDAAKDFDAIQVTSRYRFQAGDGWEEIIVPMIELNPHGLEFARVVLRASRPVGDQWVLLDKLALTKAPTSIPERHYTVRDATLKVRCDLPTHRISPFIYGLNDVDAPESLKAGAYRWGGNPTSRYNWKLGNAWNTGSDWFFENVQLTKSWRDFVEAAVARDAHFTITVPLIGWVAKDTTSHSFPVSVYGKQEQTDSWRTDAGNGVRPDGKPIQPGDPRRTSIAAPPSFVAEWVKIIREEDERRGGKRQRSYILDNEPMLWNTTHRDVHPEPLTYDELLDRTVRYASAVRAADPDALLVGPAFWGWSNYFWSAKDALEGFTERPDRRAHGDVPLLDWYLSKLREHEKRTGQRLIDVVDLHFYPQGKGISRNGGGGDTDPDTNARRLRATRGLWDPEYHDESWINEKIRLIPRLKEIIQKNYPGLGISIGEWNFGAERHMSGALALAEALGRFAEGGVHSAYYWTAPRDRLPSYWAFRAYRNFDGHGGRFLDQYVKSEVAENTSMFVSTDARRERLVAIVINPDPEQGVAATIDVASCGMVRSRQTFLYAGHPKGFEGPVSTDSTPVSQRLPPYSLAVIDMRLAAQQP